MGNTIKNWEKQRRREEKQMQQKIQTEVMGYFMSRMLETATSENLLRYYQEDTGMKEPKKCYY